MQSDSGQKVSEEVKANPEGATEIVNSDVQEVDRLARVETETSEATKKKEKKKCKEHDEALGSTHSDGQESESLAEMNGDEIEAICKRKKKKHKQQTEIISDSSGEQDCGESLSKVNGEEADVPKKKKKKKHKEHVAVVDSQEEPKGEGFARVNGDEVVEVPRKKKRRVMEVAGSTGITSSTLGGDQRVKGEVDDLPKTTKKKKQSRTEQNVDSIEGPVMDGVESKKGKNKKSCREEESLSKDKGIVGKKRKQDTSCDEEAVPAKKCKAVEEVDCEPNDGASQPSTEKHKKKHKRNKELES